MSRACGMGVARRELQLCGGFVSVGVSGMLAHARNAGCCTADKLSRECGLVGVRGPAEGVRTKAWRGGVTDRATATVGGEVRRKAGSPCAAAKAGGERTGTCGHLARKEAEPRLGLRDAGAVVVVGNVCRVGV
mmetsp:Transcript_126830/g.370808  ORF Transcript_126830/g.370808 Transcript_126830/m.370808 type:complete len:133 (+) Transcript_126830:1509-1907(+)